MIPRLLAGAALALGFGGAACAADLGVCAWERLPANERGPVIAAYQRDLRTGANTLKAFDSEIRAGAAACGATPGLPVFMVRTATIAEAMQVSMAQVLSSARGLDRPQLDAAWADASPGLKACFLNSAAKLYHLRPPACPDPRTTLLLVQNLGIPAIPGQRTAARAALVYFAGKAESEYANAIVAMYARGKLHP